MNTVYFFPNGVTVVVNDTGQIPGLQIPWAKLYADFLEQRGLDPSQFELKFPNGITGYYERTDTGWTWRTA